MKTLLLLGLFLLPSTAARAQPTKLNCPSETTVEMRYCAGVQLEKSTKYLNSKLPTAIYQQWQEASKAVCTAAYAPYKDGSIYPQLLIGCNNKLNRALLKEFKGMDQMN